MTYSDLKVGQKDSITKVITDKDIRMFAEVSCDTNPLHLDEEYAKTTIFGKRIAHGMLSCGLISAVLANKLPGPGTIYLSQEVKFLAPVFIGDEVKAELEVTELRDDKKIVTLATNCYKQDGTQVASGKAVVKFNV